MNLIASYKSFHIQVIDHKSEDILYILGDENQEIPTTSMNVVCISNIDWNADLTPWPAKKVFKQGEDFSGKGDAFLEDLMRIIALVEEKPYRRHLLGYSLAGMFALYVSIKSTLFEGVASVSGSLWYPGFVAYMSENMWHVSNVYLSLGNTEKNSKNQSMAEVETCTQKIYERGKEMAKNCVFEINNGGHFNEVTIRIQKAVDWIEGLESQ